MANYVHKVTNEIRLSVNPLLAPQPPADWWENPDGLLALLVSGVSERHVKITDLGGGASQAEEMSQAEKDAVDLALIKAQKALELSSSLTTTAANRQTDGAAEPDIQAQIDAAATPAAAAAIDVTGGETPSARGRMVGDSIYLVMSAPGAAIPATNSWTKVPGTTGPLGNSIGKSFDDDGGADNRIRCRFDGRAEFYCLCSVTFAGADGRAELALSKNGGAPSANFQLAGCTVTGAVGAYAQAAIAGPIDVADGDTFELWIDPQGSGSSAQVAKLQFWAKRIPG